MTSRVLSFILVAMLLPAVLQAQSSTTEALHKQHAGALNLFFYNNTLRMINQAEDPEFDELIKNIEKMRFIMIKKEESTFGNAQYTSLVSDYKKESFEEVLTSRHDGKRFDVFLKEDHGKTSGMLVLINDDENLYVLDILGRIALDQITKLYSTLDESTDISNKIRAFTDSGKHAKNNNDTSEND